MNLKVHDDHWAFLEEIEAPLWVDLSLEAESKDQAIDDDWFYTSHLFHQCSSSELKSAFSHFGDGSSTSSPKLPNSVSKSRGKEYRSKNWKRDNQDFLSNKSHPVKALTEKSSRVELGDRNIGKSHLTFERPKEALSLKTCDVSASSSGKAMSSKLHSESNPTSTITSESGQYQHIKISDVPNHAHGQTNGLLAIMRKSLRSSYITRQAARGEINNDGKQLQGRNSTSSKSSIGSSSNPRSGVRVSMSRSVRTKEITPDSRNAVNMTSMTKSKVNVAENVKALSIKADEGTSNSRRGKIYTPKLHGEAANNKVHNRDSRVKALAPSRINEQKSYLEARKLKKKNGIDESNKLAGYGKITVRERTSVTGYGKENARGRTLVTGNGKENVTGRTFLSHKKSDGRVVPGGESIEVRVQKGTRETRLGMNGKPGAIANKGKVRGQLNLEKPKSSVQRVHFR